MRKTSKFKDCGVENGSDASGERADEGQDEG